MVLIKVACKDFSFMFVSVLTNCFVFLKLGSNSSGQEGKL